MEVTSILLLSCYEMGHQPLNLAWPLAALDDAGLKAVAVDLSVESFPEEAARSAELVAISAPMHTALRLGVEAARRVRAINAQAHICFYGLYAWMNASYLLGATQDAVDLDDRSDEDEWTRNGALADSVIAGEVEPPLVKLAQAVLGNRRPDEIAGVVTRTSAAEPHLKRIPFSTPARASLATLDHYARYVEDGTASMAGYAESTRGCLHTCRHCPVVPVYKGRFFVVPKETVLADIRQQVEMGARHITFGDPDFLNGPGHALAVARSLHEAFPHVTFDFTTKVEHILEQQGMLGELAAYGATFVVSAFESTSDRVLAKLHKGHTVADMDTALAILRDAGIAPQPTWMPFTPWTTLDDYLYMLDWIRSRGLIPHIAAVQLSIRMLVPPGSALLQEADTAWLGTLDAENFSYAWQHPDPRMDRLQQTVARIAEMYGADDDAYGAFREVEKTAYQLAQRQLPDVQWPAVLDYQPPKLTEHWFC